MTVSSRPDTTTASAGVAGIAPPPPSSPKSVDGGKRGSFATTTVSSPVHVRQWLLEHSQRKHLAVLDTFLRELRNSRLTQKQKQQQGGTITKNASDAAANNYGQRWMTAQKTINLIRYMVGSTSWKTAAELLLLLRGLGMELQAAAGPNEPALGNLVRRVMAAVREETIREAQEEEQADTTTNTTSSATAGGGGGRLSLESMLWALPQHVRSTSSSFRRTGAVSERQESLASEAELLSDDKKQQQDYPDSYYASRPNLKQAVLEAIQEIMTDLEDLHRNINEQVTNHIHEGEIILTCGNSKTVELFLKAAHAKNFKPTVMVCGSGYDMATRLAETGIDTTFIETAAVFAVMSRVHKVILPAFSVLANGGMVSDSGCNLVAMAAREMSVPVVVVTGMYKLCPLYPHEGQDTLQELRSPVPEILQNYSELSDPAMDRVEFVNPALDLVEPKFVSLFITNVGCFQPSFIYRLLAENYHSDDWKSFG